MTSLPEFNSFRPKTAVYARLMKFGRFVLVGAATAALYAALIAFMLNRELAGPPWATAVAYIAAVSFNYFMHYSFTFSTNRPHRSSVPRFLAVNALMFSLVTTATAMVPSRLNISFVWVQAVIFFIASLAAFIIQSAFAFANVDDEVRVSAEPE